MRSHFSHEIKFIQHRKQFFILSGVLIVLSLVGLLTHGLVFGIEFSGGTEADYHDTGAITIEKMREAYANAGEKDVTVQTAEADGKAGFLVRSNVTDPQLANEHAQKVAQDLALPASSYQITTIGPDWGSDVTRTSVVAFLAAIALIIAYVAFRYEYKMSLTAVAALCHDLLIIVGVYAWTGIPVTPNVIAALLTIMGYSLYDTVVVFHRTNENAEKAHDAEHRTYYQIANYSINEVFIRTINTSVTSLVPVIAMLVLGGATLKDFAFAMTIGLVLGSYSSIAIASPLLAMWKTREQKWAKLEKKYGDTQTRLASEAGEK